MYSRWLKPAIWKKRTGNKSDLEKENRKQGGTLAQTQCIEVDNAEPSCLQAFENRKQNVLDDEGAPTCMLIFWLV